MSKTRVGMLAPVALAVSLMSTGAMASGRVASPSLWDGGVAAATGPVPNTSNSSAPSNWRLTAGSTFNGVAGAFDGTALLLFTASGLSGTYACSGSLLQGGQYVLTAAHCVQGLISMSVQFGYTNNVALQTRTAVAAYQAPGWNGTLDTGADIALVKLNAPVTNLPTYKLSTTNDVGKTYIMTGYGTTNTGSSTTGSSWSDSAYGHYGYNTFDTTSATFEAAWDATTHEGIYTAPTYGQTYVSDFDFYNGTSTQNNQYNTLQRIANATGSSAWTSGTSLGATEALIAGGDSGGGDFVWDGTQWVLSAVHSWGWQFCPGRIGPSGAMITGPSCDYQTNNGTSYGDLSGSTSVADHVQWINSVMAVPEPGTYGLMALGLAFVGGVARRRRG